MSEESQDEMGQQITYKSFKIAYFVLVVVMFLLLIFSEGFSMGANLDGVKTSLFIAICSSFFIYPIVELIVAKQVKMRFSTCRKPHLYIYILSTIAFNLFTVRQFLTVAGVCNF